MSASDAKRCFEENIKLFANAQTEPEKYNLYNGLCNLAESLERIERELQQVQSKVDDLKRGQ